MMGRTIANGTNLDVYDVHFPHHFNNFAMYKTEINNT